MENTISMGRPSHPSSMRSLLLPFTGFALVAIAVAVIVIGNSSPVPASRAAATGSKRESVALVPSHTSISLSAGEKSTSPASFVSRNRREKSHVTPVTRSSPTTPSVPTRTATTEEIHAALRASGSTQLSALRPVDFPAAQAAPDPAALVAVDPDAPGNRLTTSEHSIIVESYQPVPAGNELNVLITPTGETPSVHANGGFTREEEQFRAKWGWAAYDQVKRTAKFSTETR